MKEATMQFDGAVGAHSMRARWGLGITSDLSRKVSKNVFASISLVWGSWPAGVRGQDAEGSFVEGEW